MRTDINMSGWVGFLQGEKYATEIDRQTVRLGDMRNGMGMAMDGKKGWIAWVRWVELPTYHTSSNLVYQYDTPDIEPAVGAFSFRVLVVVVVLI